MGRRIPEYSKAEPAAVGAIRSDGHSTFIGAACPACGKVRWVQRVERTQKQVCRECSRGNLRIPWAVDDEMRAWIASQRPIDELVAALSSRHTTTKAAIFFRLRRLGFDYRVLKIQDEEREARAWASQRGGEVVGLVRGTKGLRFRFRCGAGHPAWDSPLWRIRAGSWCKACGDRRSAAKRTTITDEAISRIIGNHGGKIIYANAGNGGVKERRRRARVLFATIRCTNGHEFTIAFEKLAQGQWCAYCRTKGKVGERLCRAYFEHFSGSLFPATWPSWLVGPKGSRLELDGYSEALRIASEYHGKQHYEYLPHFHRTPDTRKQGLAYDRLKARLCRARGVTLITVSYKIPFGKLGKFILRRCQVLRLPIRDSSIPDFTSFKIGDDELARLGNKARRRGGDLVSTVYGGSARPLEWRCAKGHHWFQKPYHIMKGVWCPYCAGKCRTFPDAREIGKRKGLLLLTKETATDVDARAMLSWRCQAGHAKFQMSLRQMISRRGCPVCTAATRGGKTRFSVEYFARHPEIREAARRRALGRRPHNKRFSKELLGEITLRRQGGASLDEIAGALGVHKGTIYAWLRRSLASE